MLQKEARLGTAGAEGLLALRHRRGEHPELFPVFGRNRGRDDPQDPAHGGGHKIRIQLPDHREGSVVLPVKGLDPDLPCLLSGEDLDLVFEKRENLLDDQDLLRALQMPFQEHGRQRPGRPKLEDGHTSLRTQKRHGLAAVEGAGAARNDQQLRRLRSFIGIEGTFLEESNRLPELFLLEAVFPNHRGTGHRPAVGIGKRAITEELRLSSGGRQRAENDVPACV